MENIIYWENYYVTQHKMLYQIFKKKQSEIVWNQWVVKEEKLFRRKYTIDALADPATVDFGCVILSGQSKKWQYYRGRQTYWLSFFFLLYIKVLLILVSWTNCFS